MSTFALQISAWVEKTKSNADQVTRYALMEIDKRIINRSPVGDPKYWKHNPNAPKVFGKFGATGPKKDWQLGFLSGETSSYRMGGAGYVGGRFRANWQMSIGTPAGGVLDAIDQDGKATLDSHAIVVSIAKAGQVFYLMNNLPYAQCIERGWSRQAPVGVVALTVVEWNNIVNDAVNGVRAGTSVADFKQGYESYGL
ncbi:hypothetical protein [Duganella callida]|uniref:HK97 gp10 family phage protein n=1 Tax=Duganella callida TaxID=2561932 RepID=A0A4Y9S7F3_9BURK|nr:hypothetical protein [Duganella callida]TFW15967.1 hypothetical protein E4L98_25065 [Duganella callida]